MPANDCYQSPSCADFIHLVDGVAGMLLAVSPGPVSSSWPTEMSCAANSLPRTRTDCRETGRGGFSKREPWINFSQETLKELAKDPKWLRSSSRSSSWSRTDQGERKAEGDRVSPCGPPGTTHAETRPYFCVPDTHRIDDPRGVDAANLYAAYESRSFASNPWPWSAVCRPVPILVRLSFSACHSAFRIVTPRRHRGGAARRDPRRRQSEARPRSRPRLRRTVAGRRVKTGSRLGAVSTADLHRGEFTFNRSLF